LPAFIPRLTDAERQAAFPDVEGHTVHDQAVHYFALFDRLEWQGGGDDGGIGLDGKGWIGRDRDRLWFRAEGGTEAGRVGDARAHVLFGRQFSRWWDIVAGIRQDFSPGPAQTWAAVGVQGLAPYWFEIEATAYVGESGRTHARFEVEYELLLTNRLVLQPLLELDLSGKSDPERGIGSGLSSTEAGVRLRYEFRRELAPYAGVTWNRKYGHTADLAEAAGGPASRARLVTGLRLWF
jgi:copper resistance protein B